MWIRRESRLSGYGNALTLAIQAMRRGEHERALAPMKQALTLDRNEPYGLLTLGALYLHTGSYNRAGEVFNQVRNHLNDEPLVALGQGLSLLERGKRTEAYALLRTLTADDFPAAPLLTAYCRVVSGEADAIHAEMRDVTEKEANPLRLYVAGLAALRSGNTGRGEALLTALLARPGMDYLAEYSGMALLGEPSLPLQGGAPALSTAIEFPKPVATEAFYSGRVTLMPGKLPAGTESVSYRVDGGALNAMTNIPPYIVDWNTTRLPNGVYTLRITTYDGSQREIATTARTIRLANNNAPTESGRLSDEEKATLRSDLTTLLTPQPSRKAVRYLLAERAIARKATNDALTHMEAVVAMDPQFKGAFHTLRRYHDATGDVAPSLWKASVTEKAVALTFDDGPKPDGTPQLLDRLKELGIVGTFFIVGAQAEQNPGLLKRIFAEGHEIGNHSFTHPNLTYLPPIAVQRELCRTSALVRQLTGKAPRFYRPPGGNFNGAVAECAEALGMGGGYWTIDVYKFEKEPFGPKDVINFTLPKVRPGSIVLMHNGPKQTTDALPTIVKSLREKGYRFVTMTELARLTKI